MPLPADPRQGRALRVALVGIGSAATRAHLPALREAEEAGTVRVVGVCDPDRERRDAVIAGHPEAAGFAENDEMLDATSPDVLAIATPPSAHLGEIAAAAARDVHVLCEKPLGLSEDDVSTLRSLAACASSPCPGDGAPVPVCDSVAVDDARHRGCAASR